MKKHTGKIKGEFDTISSLEKRTNKIMNSFEEDKRPVTDCITVLSKTSQLVDSIRRAGNRFAKVKGRNITNGSRRPRTHHRVISVGRVF